MARKKIDKTKEYAVNRIGHCVGGDVEKAREMVARAGKLRSDIWNKYGSLSMLGNVSSKTLSRLSENQSSR